MHRTVLIFAKPPRMGLSKTRLARDVGVVEAQRVNRFCHRQTLRAAMDRRWDTGLYVAPDAACSERIPDWPAAIQRSPQGDGDLGERLTKGFAEAPPGAVLFLGTDMPDLTHHHLWTAFKALHSNDAVFGPAEDGGFWLLGLRKGVRTAPPFEKVRWSTQYAMADVRRNLAGQRIAPDLETFPDLDDAASLASWRKRFT